MPTIQELIEIVGDNISSEEEAAMEGDDANHGNTDDFDKKLDLIESSISQQKVDRVMRLIEDLNMGFYT